MVSSFIDVFRLKMDIGVVNTVDQCKKHTHEYITTRHRVSYLSIIGS